MGNKKDNEAQKYLKDQQDKLIKQYCNATGHRIPVTRRELLASGVIGSASWILAPTLVQILSMGEARAQAVDCGDSAGGATEELAPFFTVSLRGGAALNAHVLPLDPLGDLLPSYSSLGRGNPSNPVFRTLNLFGNTWFETSSFLNGLIQGVSQNAQDLTTIRNGVATTITTPDPDPLVDSNGDGDPANDTTTVNKSATVLADEQSNAIENFVSTHPVLSKVGVINICNRSQSDSNTNKFDISSWLQASGYTEGRKVPFMGNRDTATGIGHNFAGTRPDAPLIVNSVNDIATAMGAATDTMGNFTQAQRIQLFQLVNNLTTQQAAKLSRMPAAEKLGTLAQCATGKNIESAQQTDPSGQLLTGTGAIWTGDENSGNMAMAVLKGYSAAAGIEMGGYDYHGNARDTVTDPRDENAGRLVGKLLASAALENKKCVIQVVSDGSCVSGISDNPEGVGWATDSSERAMILMFAYDPNSANGPVISENQIGAYLQVNTDRQVVDTSTLVGGNVEIAAASVFANLMALNGKSPAQVAEVLGGMLSANQLAGLMKIAG